MGAQQVGFSKNCENGKKGLSGADFFLEKLEGMGKGMADGPTQAA
jgi:hypothetical protein